MARQRIINPEFWLDEDLAKLSPYARLLYIGLWGICDDNYATFPDKAGWIKIQVFPYEDVSIPDLLQELSSSTRIVLFEDNGQKYYFIKNFFKYQRIDHPSKAKYPRYPGVLAEASPVIKLSNISNLNNPVKEKSSRELLKENINQVIKKKSI